MDLQLRRLEQFLFDDDAPPPRRGNDRSTGLSPQMVYKYFAGIPLDGLPSLCTEVQQLWGARSNFPAVNERQQLLLKSSPVHTVRSPRQLWGAKSDFPTLKERQQLLLKNSPVHTVRSPQQLWRARSDFPFLNERQQLLLMSSPVHTVSSPEKQRCVEEGSSSGTVPQKLAILSPRVHTVPCPQERRCVEEGNGSGTVPKKLAVLPEELVEKIFSSLPFPDVMHSRILNKSWASKFTDGLDGKGFQDQVKAVSNKWQYYCPILLNLKMECLVGFDRRGNRWHQLDVAFAGDLISQGGSLRHLRGAGSLICGVVRCEIFVINIVLRTCVWLPPRPHMEFPHEVHLLSIGSDAYRLLVITTRKGQDVPTEVYTQIYDSQTNSWSVVKSTVNSNLQLISSAYMDGVLYSVVNDNDVYPHELKVLAYNIETGIWATIPHPFEHIMHRIETYELMIGRSQIMIVLHLRSSYRRRDPTRTTIRKTLLVYTLNTATLKITLVTRGPPETLCEPNALFVSDNKFLYFGNPQVAGSSVVELNLRTAEWRVLPPSPYIDGSCVNRWLKFSFSPGLNPFVQL